ncbi:hypothetical protein F4604DRAFT_1690659 [Suillus subluteus]|nr:hypothetical protein F4604DRAFT_1690659 [Suillus subluteus]
MPFDAQTVPIDFPGLSTEAYQAQYRVLEPLSLFNVILILVFLFLLVLAVKHHFHVNRNSVVKRLDPMRKPQPPGDVRQALSQGMSGLIPDLPIFAKWCEVTIRVTKAGITPWWAGEEVTVGWISQLFCGLLQSLI